MLQINAQYLDNSSYQIVLRNEKNQLLTNDSVDLKITILNTTIIKYEELHSVTTNSNGLASITLGKGKVIYGELEDINLGNGTFFVKSEYKLKNETTFKTIETNQLMSVPSAIYANNGIPEGATNGQILTFCEGKPQWRDYGQCPTNLTITKCPKELDKEQYHNEKLFIGSDSKGLRFTIEFDKNEYEDWPIWPNQKLISTTDSNLIATSHENEGSRYQTFHLSGIPTVKGQDSTSFIFKFKELTCKATFAVLDPENLTKPGNGVTDKFGNKYKTMIVGNNEWMAENLIVSEYTNDQEFPEHINAFIIDTLAKFDNKTVMVKYNLENVCPNGWSIPSEEDWRNLSDHFGRLINNQIYGFIPKGLLNKHVEIVTNEEAVIDTINYTSAIIQQKSGGYWWTSNREIDRYWSDEDYYDYYSTYNSHAAIFLSDNRHLYITYEQCNFSYSDYKDWQYYDWHYGKFNAFQRWIVGPRANVRCIKNI
jgi:uncharacterized protein (TIGR02145 family)